MDPAQYNETVGFMARKHFQSVKAYLEIEYQTQMAAGYTRFKILLDKKNIPGELRRKYGGRTKEL